MTDAIPLDEWLRRIDDEYLSGFVRDGGAAVKFAVTPDEARPALRDALERRCRESGYLFVALDIIPQAQTIRRCDHLYHRLTPLAPASTQCESSEAVVPNLVMSLLLL